MSKVKSEDLLGKMMICYNCGHRNLITNPKCTTCGVPLKTVKLKNQKGREIGEVIKDDSGKIISIKSKNTGCLGILVIALSLPFILFIIGA